MRAWLGLDGRVERPEAIQRAYLIECCRCGRREAREARLTAAGYPPKRSHELEEMRYYFWREGWLIGPGWACCFCCRFQPRAGSPGVTPDTPSTGNGPPGE
jgi:hypothetical protein